MRLHDRVHHKHIKATGEVIEGWSPNLRTNDGTNWQAQVMGNQWGDVSIATNAPLQIAVTEDTTTPVSTMTNLLAELSADGMSRITATFAHTVDQSVFTQTASFQYTGASTITVATAALATALTNLDTSEDTHFAITALSAVVVMNSNDTIQVDWGFDT